MQLTGPQLRTVQYYLRHRDRAPTWGGFLRGFVRTLAVYLAIGSAVCYLCVALGRPMLTYLAVGMLVGAILRDVRHHHYISQVWPAIAAIVDWERAQALAGPQRPAEPGGAADGGA